jgi:hypothetical protein
MSEEEQPNICRVPIETEEGDKWVDIISDDWDEALRIVHRDYFINVKHLDPRSKEVLGLKQ